MKKAREMNLLEEINIAAVDEVFWTKIFRDLKGDSKHRALVEYFTCQDKYLRILEKEENRYRDYFFETFLCDNNIDIYKLGQAS